jgi:FlaA1/EpsC-like NDP-sugar epimerase
VDIKIAYCGVRPGEKLYEELAIDGEGVSRTPHPKVGIWKNIAADWDALVKQMDRLVADADHLPREEARRRLREIVPEFYVEAPAASPGPSAHAVLSVAAVNAKAAPA